jgi:hypothetical protein
MKRIIAAIFTAVMLGGLATPAFADAPPPTNGGNGGGQSGQCSGSPDDRPAVCPAT